MDKKHKDLIDENLKELVEVTQDIDKVVDKLFEEKVLNRYMADLILKEYADEKRQAIEFYNFIKSRGPNAFNKLIYALRQTENYKAEKILKLSSISYFSPAVPIKETMKIHPKTSDVKDNVNAEELIVKIHPERKFMDVDEQNKPCGTFKMRSKPRGLALIININKARNQKERRGSEFDVRKLDKLFKDIGYKVTLYRDLTRKEMKDKIIAFSQNPELANVDSSLVFIMSHGRRRGDELELVASDGEILDAKWIIEQFTVSNSSLVSTAHERKPKLFFFESCRMQSWNPSELNVSHCGNSLSNLKLNVSYPKNLLSESNTSTLHTQTASRNFEDMVIVYSTVDGFPSMRDSNEGTWFVNAFCRILAERAWENDLETMMGLVDEELRGKYDDRYGFQTVEVKKLGATSRKIFFNPGL